MAANRQAYRDFDFSDTEFAPSKLEALKVTGHNISVASVFHAGHFAAERQNIFLSKIEEGQWASGD